MNDKTATSSTIPAPPDDTAPHNAVDDDLAVVVLVLKDCPLTAHEITGMGREALIQYIRLLEAERTMLRKTLSEYGVTRVHP